MIQLVSMTGALIWTCDECFDNDEDATHTVDFLDIQGLWCDALQHVADSHRRVGADIYVGINVLALTKQFFDTAKALQLTLESPVRLDLTEVLDRPS